MGELAYAYYKILSETFDVEIRLKVKEDPNQASHENIYVPGDGQGGKLDTVFITTNQRHYNLYLHSLPNRTDWHYEFRKMWENQTEIEHPTPTLGKNTYEAF